MKKIFQIEHESEEWLDSCMLTLERINKVKVTEFSEPIETRAPVLCDSCHKEVYDVPKESEWCQCNKIGHTGTIIDSKDICNDCGRPFRVQPKPKVPEKLPNLYFSMLIDDEGVKQMWYKINEIITYLKERE